MELTKNSTRKYITLLFLSHQNLSEVLYSKHFPGNFTIRNKAADVNFVWHNE